MPDQVTWTYWHDKTIAGPDTDRPDVRLEMAEEEAQGDDPFVAVRSPDRYERAIARIPPIEADSLEMLLLGKTQREIGEIFSTSQPMISYYAAKAIKRLTYLVSGPGSMFDPEDVTTALGPFLTPREVLILKTLWESTSTAHVARAAGLSKSSGSLTNYTLPRIFRRLRELASTHPELAKFSSGFDELWRSWRRVLAYEPASQSIKEGARRNRLASKGKPRRAARTSTNPIHWQWDR